tara:strand:+ start:5096 stop:7303 length:2208 start_codon:yes stop_codon:yes gene_type:complete
MKKITLLLSAFSLVWGLNAQKTTAVKANVSTSINNTTVQATPPAPSQRNCATMEVDAAMRAANPDMGTLEDFEEWLAPRVEAYKQAVANGTAPEVVYTIPVIVHVIHNSNESVGQGRNISQAQVQSQIDVLNEDFRRLNSDASNTPSVFQSVAADVEIEFCLAQVDPNGNVLPEPGIDRVSATSIGLSNTTSGYSTSTIDGTIKPATSWDPNNYFNIWVTQISGGILGYAQFPSNSGLPGLNTNGGAANTDGVVIGYNYFGRTGTVSAPYNLGRTATHEVGHWLGLRHIWGDANCGNDYCNDTPTQQTSNNGCPSFPNVTCSNGPNGDMFMNYMDYVNDNCMNTFTLDQKARMVAVITGATRRASLLNSTVCSPAALTANFTSNTTTINAGQTVTFTDQSTGPNPITTWSWNFDVGGLGGVSPATASTQGPHTVTYNTAGTYTVSLTVGDGSSTDTKTNYTITVNPPGTVTCDSVGNWLINPDASDASTGVYTWGAGNGYVMGNNTYGDLAWADKVTFSQTGKELTEVIYFFGVATGSGNVELKVWNDNAGSPGTVAASQSVAISSITPGSGMQWTLSPAVPLSGDFYVGYDHGGTTPPAGDTVAVFSTSKSSNSMWALESNNAWVDLSAYGVNHAAAIIPIACDIATGQKEAMVSFGEVKLFPNPTTGSISVILPNREKSEIQVYNMIGELVFTTSSSNTNYVSVNLEDQPNGVYFVSVKNNDTVTTQKVIISK